MDISSVKIFSCFSVGFIYLRLSVLMLLLQRVVGGNK